MLDGIYQSVVSFFIPYVFVVITTSASGNGMDVAERLRLGAYIAHPAIFTINSYILLNTYRWDWLMLLVVGISDVFIFFWTGVWTAFTYAQGFYQAAPQIYSELTFWMCLIITPAICLMPRIVVKCLQKQRFPYDVDIIREQAKLGKFADADAAKQAAVLDGTAEGASATSSSSSTGKLSGRGRHRPSRHGQYASVDEDRRPIYPPSIATHNTRTQNASDGTTYIMQSRESAELARQRQEQFEREMEQLERERVEENRRQAAAALEQQPQIETTSGAGTPIEQQVSRTVTRPSIDRARPSYDRVRRSMDRVRPSFEASNDFTSAARLSRIESTHSAQGQHGQRRFNLTTVRKRGLSAFSKKSIDP
jgi:phospholipid-translocating ATPase